MCFLIIPAPWAYKELIGTKTELQCLKIENGLSPGFYTFSLRAVLSNFSATNNHTDGKQSYGTAKYAGGREHSGFKSHQNGPGKAFWILHGVVFAAILGIRADSLLINDLRIGARG